MAKAENQGSKNKTWMGYAAAGVAAFAGISWFVNLSNIAKDLVIVTSANFDFNAFAFVVLINIKNPVGQSIRIKAPFVTIKDGSDIIASSNPTADILTIPANGTSQGKVTIPFDKVKLLTTAPALMLTLANGGKVSLVATTQTGLVTMLLGTTEIIKTETWNIG